MSLAKVESRFTGGWNDGKGNSVDDEERAYYYRAGRNAYDRRSPTRPRRHRCRPDFRHYDRWRRGRGKKNSALRLLLQKPSLSRRSFRWRKRRLQDEGRRHRRPRPLDLGAAQDSVSLYD